MFVLEEATIVDIQKAFKDGSLSSRDLVLMHLERIKDIDKSGPNLNSISQINPDAIFIAEAMDRERLNGKIRSPLHGIPIVLKDSINTYDKMTTPAGSIALKDNYAEYDATAVKKLREAGLVILGKTNMTELANYMSSSMKNGFSSLGRQVKNPYVKDGEVGGSSTGSAVAVSANLCSLALGTETDASITAPSYINGTVGIKPTLGLISRHGIIPIATAQDTLGPMTRTVEDAAALLNIIAGEDINDPATWERETTDYTKYLVKDGLKGMRVGINRTTMKKDSFLRFDDEMIRLSQNVFDLIKDLGADIIEADIKAVVHNGYVLNYEFKNAINYYLAHTNPNTKNKNLKDMIDYLGEHSEIGLKYGMDILLETQYETSGNLTETKYLLERLKVLNDSRNRIDKLMDEKELDVILSPGFTNLAPISGYPCITVPAGYKKDGTPFGITFLGKSMGEPSIIKAAYAYEQGSKHRKAPKF